MSSGLGTPFSLAGDFDTSSIDMDPEATALSASLLDVDIQLKYVEAVRTAEETQRKLELLEAKYKEQQSRHNTVVEELERDREALKLEISSREFQIKMQALGSMNLEIELEELKILYEEAKSGADTLSTADKDGQNPEPKPDISRLSKSELDRGRDQLLVLSVSELIDRDPSAF